jgi:ketosteroid isomerase-like protein
MVRPLTATVLAFSLTACCSLEEARDIAEVDRGVRATLDAQVAAWNSGDVKGFMAGYAPLESTTFLSGTTLTRGHTTVSERFLARYPKGNMGTLAFESVEITALPGGEAAYAVGRFKLTGDVRQSGMFTLVLRRFGGRYLVVHDHTSADPPPG